MTIKEKVLKAVKKEYNWWEMNEPEELLFNETLAERNKEVGKVIGDLVCHCDFCKGKLKHNIKGKGKLIDIKELKQKLGIK